MHSIASNSLSNFSTEICSIREFLSLVDAKQQQQQPPDEAFSLTSSWQLFACNHNEMKLEEVKKKYHIYRKDNGNLAITQSIQRFYRFQNNEKKRIDLIRADAYVGSELIRAQSGVSCLFHFHCFDRLAFFVVFENVWRLRCRFLLSGSSMYLNKGPIRQAKSSEKILQMAYFRREPHQKLVNGNWIALSAAAAAAAATNDLVTLCLFCFSFVFLFALHFTFFFSSVLLHLKAIMCTSRWANKVCLSMRNTKIKQNSKEYQLHCSCFV